MAPIEDAAGWRAAGEIADREVAEGQDRGIDARMEALGEARLAPIGRAERMAETRNPADVMAPGAGTERDRLGPELVADRQHALGNLIQRFVPGDALPFARSAGAETPHRILQAVGMVHQIDGHGADRAQAAVVQRRGRIALDLDQLTVANMQERAATAMATAADALEHLRVAAYRGSLLLRRPGHIHGACSKMGPQRRRRDGDQNHGDSIGTKAPRNIDFYQAQGIGGRLAGIFPAYARNRGYNPANSEFIAVARVERKRNPGLMLPTIIPGLRSAPSGLLRVLE